MENWWRIYNYLEKEKSIGATSLTLSPPLLEILTGVKLSHKIDLKALKKKFERLLS